MCIISVLFVVGNVLIPPSLAHASRTIILRSISTRTNANLPLPSQVSHTILPSNINASQSLGSSTTSIRIGAFLHSSFVVSSTLHTHSYPSPTPATPARPSTSELARSGFCARYRKPPCQDILNQSLTQFKETERYFDSKLGIDGTANFLALILDESNAFAEDKRCKWLVEVAMCQYILSPCMPNGQPYSFCREGCQSLTNECKVLLNRLIGSAAAIKRVKGYDFTHLVLPTNCSVYPSWRSGNKSCVLLGSFVISYNFDIHLLNVSQIGAQAENIEAKIKNVLEDSLLLRSVNVTVVNITSGIVTLNLAWHEQDLVGYETKDGNGKEKFDTAAIAGDVYKRLEDNNILVVSFFINAEPGPATGLSIKQVTSSTISFSWQPPEYFSVTEYQIQLNDGGSGWKNSKKISGSETSAKIDSLDPGTKYLIRMKSINGHGTGIPSKVIETETEADTVSTIIIAVVVVVVILVVIAIVLGVLYYRRKSKLEDNILMGEINPYTLSMPGVAPENIYVCGNETVVEIDTGDISKDGTGKKYYSWREINRESLTMRYTLGQGEYGLVVKAIWDNEEAKAQVPVAVKTIKDNATETDRKELLKELRLMADFSQHRNVVNLIGACSKGGPLWVIVELCEHGNLLSFLRKNRREIPERTGDFNSSLDPLVRVRIAYDVSKGMHYLEDKKIVHRDLAARNILLGKNKIAKIADFGLSRDIYQDGLYQKNTGGKLPVKWMAIESLKDETYTSKSDVWSFGVLFWEIESAGLVPYPGIGGGDILGCLLNGVRLDRPSETPFEIYEIMKKCWEPSPKVRPHFSEIESELAAYLEERLDYLPVLKEEERVDDKAYINYIVSLEDETTSLQ